MRFVSFNIRFALVSFRVSLEIQGFLVILPAGILASIEFLIASSDLLACSSSLQAD